MQFRESNLEVASLVNAPDDIVGVLADDEGRVRGLWASFASDNGRELVQENRGMSSDLVAETLDIVRQGRPLHSLEAEFTPQTLASARAWDLSDAWVLRIEKANPSAREVLSVARLVAGSDAAHVLQPGDILLAIDDKPVTQFRDVELAVANKEVVNATVWRADGEKNLTVRTASALRQRHRAAGAMGRCDVAGAAPRHQRATRHSADGRLYRIFSVRLAGGTLWAGAGTADRRSGWPAHARS